MKLLNSLPNIFAGILIVYTSNAFAGTTFLPDWQQADLEFKRDEPLCTTAVDSNGNKLYHKADGCPAPKIFDEYCAHDDRYISECYCPTYYQYDCTFPYRGDERVREHGYASCDGLFIACCDTRCPSGTSEYDPGGCGGSTTNDCGDTCYYPYEPCCYPYDDETGCSCGTYTCDDGCGGSRTCCESCPEPDPDPEPDPEPTPSPDPEPSYPSNPTPSNPCSGVSCPTAVSCGTEGCKSYSTSTNCCSKVCTECNAKQESCVPGGSESCSGQTSSCGSDQIQTNSCKDCSGTTRYSCRACSNSCSSGSLSVSCSASQNKVPVSTTECGNKCYTCEKKNDWSGACGCPGFISSSDFASECSSKGGSASTGGANCMCWCRY